MALVDQLELEQASSGDAAWRYQAFKEIAECLRPPSSFPCVFSQNAFKRHLLQFIFVDTADDENLILASRDLALYTQAARAWDGAVNTARPLVVAFSLEAAKFDTLADYHRFGWRVLQVWHENDPVRWPEEVATNPHQPFWSMCFDGTQLFVNMSAPAHRVRRSRNLGQHFLFIVNPRERFDIVAGDTPEGRTVRSHIRKRVEDYDGYPHSLQLGSYQAGEIEWWQYGIIETNEDRTDRCPFVFRGRDGTK
jgi:FPC/CPF motif-containing protein YcgG